MRDNETPKGWPSQRRNKNFDCASMRASKNFLAFIRAPGTRTVQFYGSHRVWTGSAVLAAARHDTQREQGL